MPRIFPTYSAIALPAEKSVLNNPPVYGNSPVFDFNTGEFQLNPDGDMLIATQREALVAWIRKTLVTPRYVHGIYPTWYGSEVLKHIGGDRRTLGTVSPSVVGDIERNIREALLVDRRILDVGNFRSLFENDHVTTTFTVATTLGALPQITVETEI